MLEGCLALGFRSGIVTRDVVDEGSRTAVPNIYAVGDVTSVGTPKAGVFAEGQAAVVAAQISARIRGETATQTYDGTGVCYLEFGHDLVARVSVTFLSGEPPAGELEGPSEQIALDKVDFGAGRIRRWFGREWAAAGSP